MKEIWVTVPAHLSHNGTDYRKIVGVDACLVPLIEALNNAGISTVASCCGHGKKAANIILSDGRELFLVSDSANSRKLESLLESNEIT